MAKEKDLVPGQVGSAHVTKHPNGVREETRIIKLSDKHPVNPGGTTVVKTFRNS